MGSNDKENQQKNVSIMMQQKIRWFSGKSGLYLNSWSYQHHCLAVSTSVAITLSEKREGFTGV